MSEIHGQPLKSHPSWTSCLASGLCGSLDLSDAVPKITSSIPTEIGLMGGLTLLALDDNLLTGTIPTELGLATLLDTLQIQRNHLNGSLPTELGGLSNVTSVDVSENMLTGAIPTELGRMLRLRSLYLHDNQLGIPYTLENQTVLPTELGLIPPLFTIFAHDNVLAGSIPLEISNLPVLTLCNNIEVCGPVPNNMGLTGFGGEVPYCSEGALAGTNIGNGTCNKSKLVR
eukprot:CAMPEP_0114236104 /NCGR_PEP_ID=MMETSP0058-20121206/6642_1 /TAXON_ID=36894 /ORGANISM="Pyramimonas parkeae, CCMP726" /LENGTH=228 /DNA_ID=CAMNT_0001347983 /DNA_START=270 /DNA_END=952 /DNA_ORIENTATION=+